MKKNVVFIVLDSFIYDKIGKQPYGPSTTPFLDELKTKTIHTTNLYSQGPFTEAGIMPLLSGNDSLNEGGYMHNLNTKKNHYIDVFHKNGYEHYNIFYPYFMYSDETLAKIDFQIFSADFVFGSVYNQRLDYFRKLHDNKRLTEENYKDAFYQLDITFSAWGNFLNYSDETKEKYELIENVLEDYDFKKNRNALSKQYNIYISDKKAYLHSIFKEQLDHSLFKIDSLLLGNFLNSSLIDKKLYKENKGFLRKVTLKQFYCNLINNKISFRKLCRSVYNNIKQRRFYGYFKSVVFSLFAGRLSYDFKKHKFEKEMPSFYTQIQYGLKAINKNNKGRPFILTLHPQDLHNRNSFFTFDTNIEAVFDQEMKSLRKYFKEVKNNFKGSLIYDFSIVYVDLCIKRLFQQLSEMKLLENTLVVITSDHGSSYVNAPVRDRFINNYHTENYKIPLFIYDNGRAEVCNSFHSSKDVLPTIYELCGIDIPTNINGRSLLENGYFPKYAISEYLGGGCPDMKLRPIQYMIRNSFYLLSYSVRLDQDFNEGEIKEIYNLKIDVTEEKNLVNSDYDNKDVNALLADLRRRHLELQERYKINLK